MLTESAKRSLTEVAHIPDTKTKTTLYQDVEATLKRLEAKDKGLGQLINKAHGHAVFPSVGKPSLMIGGSYGRGLVFEKGKFIGYATITQLTLGVQIGGDTFSEVLILESRQALDRFKLRRQRVGRAGESRGGDVQQLSVRRDGLRLLRRRHDARSRDRSAEVRLQAGGAGEDEIGAAYEEQAGKTCQATGTKRPENQGASAPATQASGG